MLTRKDRKNSYVYVYLDPRKPGKYIYGSFIFDHEPFYVGKGKEYRDGKHLKEAKKRKGNSHPKIAKIQKIWSEGLEPIIVHPQINLTNDQACDLEKKLVSLIGRYDLNLGPLTNLSDGGEASAFGSHFKNRASPTEETKKKISETLKQKYKETPCLREEVSQRIKNYYADHPDARKKASEIKKGLKQPKEQIEKRNKTLARMRAEGKIKSTKGYKYNLSFEQRERLRKSGKLAAAKNLTNESGIKSPHWKGWLLDVSNNVSYVTAKVAAKQLQVSPSAITWRLKNQPELWKYVQTPTSITNFRIMY